VFDSALPGRCYRARRCLAAQGQIARTAGTPASAGRFRPLWRGSLLCAAARPTPRGPNRHLQRSGATYSAETLLSPYYAAFVRGPRMIATVVPGSVDIHWPTLAGHDFCTAGVREWSRP